MTLADWLVHLEALHPRGQAGIELGLDRVRRVQDALGQTQHCPVITVAGTNGKGSTCAYLVTILDRGGYKVGGYASPHLLHYNERVRIGTRPVDDAALCAAFARVEAARRLAGDVALTYFEFGTLAAWEVFAAERVEVAVLEVGLGGRLDAVNVYDPDVAIVTGIALDHTDYLGPTREHIGFEKAGIFRAGKPAIVADAAPPKSLVDHAATIAADLKLIGRDFGYQRGLQQPLEERAQWRFWLRHEGRIVRRMLAYPGLRGVAQLANASAALAALDALADRLPLSMQAIRTGLIETELAGRFQVLPGQPTIVLDVAHNPQAAAVLADNLSGMAFAPRTIAIVGMLGDKDIAGTLAPLAARVDHWLAVPLVSPRAAAPDVLVETLAGITKTSCETAASVADALKRAAGLAGEADRILVFGSFLTVAAALEALGRTPLKQ